jgi:Ca-activated chloride channel family protein
MARMTLVLLVVAAAGACRKQEPAAPAGQAAPAPAATQPAAPPDAIRLVIAYGSEKKRWLEEQLTAFHGTDPRVDGRPVRVDAQAMGSGEAVQAVLGGELKPHVVSPASGAYLTLLNDAWKQRSGRDKAVAPPGEPLLLSPIVIALWKPMAEALGWPGKRLGWKELLGVAADSRGWGAFGHPEWGAFKLGHTHPELSNSGLLAVLAAAYAGAGKTRGLQAADVDGKKVRGFIAAVEKSIVHYGKSTGFFADRMLARGPSYLSAAVLYENLVVESYAKASPSGMQVVSIYPREGTFWCDHPYSILDADWVGAPERKAAEALLAFLRARPAQERALALGFRPADPAIPVAAPVDAAHGADAKQPQTLLDVPDAATLAKLLDVWKQNKRPTDVVLVFDKSGSMQGPPLAEAKRGARSFIERLQPTDEVTLLFFDTKVHPPYGPVKLADGKADLLSRIEGTFAEGGTALYAAIASAYAEVEARVARAPGRTHAVVVMTDGKDESRGGPSLDEVKQRVRSEGDQRVRVFTIGYGHNVSGEVLSDIAESAQGMSARGDVKTIVQVYDEMAAFF